MLDADVDVEEVELSEPDPDTDEEAVDAVCFSSCGLMTISHAGSISLTFIGIYVLSLALVAMGDVS